MNKKQIIQIVVIVVIFSAAGFVLYQGGLFGGGAQPALVQNSPAAVSSQQDILPYGPSLDFGQAIYPNRFNYNQIQYPQVSVQSDVGINPSNLITSLPGK